MTDYSRIKLQLEDMLTDLNSRVERIDDHLRTPGDDDWEERATELENDEVLSSLGNISVDEIKQVKHALHQIEIDAYGKCEKCGKPIQIERLDALPFATTCSKCA